MHKTIPVLLAAAICVFPQANTWVKATGAENGGRENAAMFYWPDSSRFLLTMGYTTINPQGDFSISPYDVQRFTVPEGHWVNYLPNDSLFGSAAVSDSLEALAGKWADSTGLAYGNGRTAGNLFYYHFYFKPVQGYLRPNLYYGGGSAHNQYAYDSHQGKIYYCIQNLLFTYTPAVRRWDTLSMVNNPALSEGGSTSLWWGAMAYDPVNRELVLFGGSNADVNHGSLGTWVMPTSDNTWRKLDLATQPLPRAMSAMAYDPVNQCIVLFGGDHLDYLLSDTWVYHCASRAWEKKTPALAPAPRAGHALMYLPKSGKIALLGGFDYYPEPRDYCASAYAMRPMVELWSYDVAANEWKAVKSWTRTPGLVPQLGAKTPVMAAVDTGDNIVVVAEDTLKCCALNRPKTWTLHVDASARDTAAERACGVVPGTETRHTGGWAPAWFTEGVDAPDTAAAEAALRNLAAGQWTEIRFPKWHTYSDFCWGTTRYDPVNDVILCFSGGHSSYSGNQVLQYSPHTNRMTVGYDAEVPLSGELANSGGWPTYHSFNNRPFMVVHSYTCYNFCEALERLVLVKGRHSYLYDAVKQDWDSAYLTGDYNLGSDMGVNVIQTGRTIAAWKRWQIALFDTTSRTWTAIDLGEESPIIYSEYTGGCYDPDKNRIIMAENNGGPAKTWIFSLTDSTLSKLAPEKDSILNELLAGSSQLVREAVYLPKKKGILYQTSSNGKNLYFDCVTDNWGLADIPANTHMTHNSSGLMYDAKRDVIWLYDPLSAKDRLFAFPAENLQITGLDKKESADLPFNLSASPNPFNPESRISISLPENSQAELSVFDLSGKRVKIIASGEYRAGKHTFTWNATDMAGKKVSTGLYVYKLAAGKRLMMNKALLVK